MKMSPVAIEWEAAVILDSATTAVRHILSRRMALDQAGCIDKPLIHIAGENHPLPAHHLHHMLVLDGLQKHEDVAVCCELPHNTAIRSIKALAPHSLDKASLDRMARKAPPESLDLKSFLAFTDFKMADHSGKTQMNFLLKRGLPTRFNDAALIGLGTKAPLDQHDDSTASSIKACFGKVADGIICGENPGIYVRNRHMVDEAANYIRATQPRILFQQCGNAHIANDLPGAPQGHSLPALFRRAGFSIATMPLAMHENERDFFVSQHRGPVEEFIPTRLLSRIQATGTIMPGPLYQLNNRAEEAEWLETALSSIKRPDLILSIPEHDALKERYTTELRQHYLGHGLT
jgi:hypothetical protein